MNRVDEDSIKLYMTDSGMGTAKLVFLPGLGGTSRYWRSRVATFEKRYRVLLVDPLGFGQSPKPKTHYTLERHLASLHHTLSPHAPFTLIGHSMGAILSLAYAARYPEQVERLILIGLPHFGGPEQAYRHFRNGSLFDRWFLTNITMAAAACMLTRRVFGRLLPFLLPNIPREVAEDLVKHSWQSFTSSLWELVYKVNVEEEAVRLGKRVPVFCIHGNADQTAPLSGVKSIADARSNWNLLVLPGGDHHPLLHMTEACLAGIETGLTLSHSTDRVHSNSVTDTRQIEEPL